MKLCGRGDCAKHRGVNVEHGISLGVSNDDTYPVCSYLQTHRRSMIGKKVGE